MGLLGGIWYDSTGFGKSEDLSFNSGSSAYLLCNLISVNYSFLIGEIMHTKYLAQSKLHSKLNNNKWKNIKKKTKYSSKIRLKKIA